jgi:RNA polymerase sigma-70 factor, ECF subfamily
MLADAPASSSPPSDAELARRIAASPEAREAEAREAEAELCRRFAPRVRLYGLKHLGSEERARDLVQAVLLAVLQAVRAGRVANLEHVDRFVLGTCRHLALRAREADARAEPTDFTRVELPAALPDPDLPLDLAALFRCLGELDARARSVLHLSFQRDKSAGEIAQALETTAGNVRVLRHRALARLRACLDVCEERPR